MPLHYLRRLSGRERTPRANAQLARYLAFVAGAANAGGFLAIRQYTSHMSGILSAMADNVALANVQLALAGLGALLSFVAGSACCSVLVRWARSRDLRSEYALPLLLEALLLLVFGLTGRRFPGHTVHATVALLCATMGLQNAVVTKLSGAVIRTTHVTGMLTDIGIDLGRRLFALGRSSPPAGDLPRLLLLLSLVGLFFVGGVVGALGFQHLGFLFTLPLAAILIALAVVPVVDDLRAGPVGAA